MEGFIASQKKEFGGERQSVAKWWPTRVKTQVGVASGIDLTSGSTNMQSLIGEWAGKVVSVALRVGGGYAAETKAAMLEGKLVQVGEAGVMLELPEGRTFVPISAILHISLPEGQ